MHSLLPNHYYLPDTSAIPKVAAHGRSAGRAPRCRPVDFPRIPQNGICFSAPRGKRQRRGGASVIDHRPAFPDATAVSNNLTYRSLEVSRTLLIHADFILGMSDPDTAVQDFRWRQNAKGSSFAGRR